MTISGYSDDEILSLIKRSEELSEKENRQGNPDGPSGAKAPFGKKMFIPLMALLLAICLFYLSTKDDSSAVDFAHEVHSEMMTLGQQKEAILKGAPQIFHTTAASVSGLAKMRQNQLKEAMDPLIALLQANTEGSFEASIDKLSLAMQHYLDVENAHASLIAETLETLFKEIPEDIEQRLEFFKIITHEAKFEAYLSEALSSALTADSPVR